jgi:hypothetical protein
MNDRLENYVPVAERLEKFRNEHPLWALVGEITVDDGQRVVIRATIADENERVVATGHAEEVRGSSPVNRTSAVENAETSAWGRALAALGYDVKRGIASREEVQNAQSRERDGRTAQPRQPRPPAEEPAPAGPQDDIRKRIINLGRMRDVFVISDFKTRYGVEFGKASQQQLEEYAGLLSGDGVSV